MQNNKKNMKSKTDIDEIFFTVVISVALLVNLLAAFNDLLVVMH